jgi:glycosyltransferase involved in cell wall biosynthesis
VRFAVDVTACWRPQRVGMTTVALELSKALVAHKEKDGIVLLCSRERPQALDGLECEAVLSPYRHEVNLKMRWLPAVEPQLESDAILYPYWPSPPFRRHDAPPAAIFVHDLAFRLRPHEVPWQQRAYMGTILYTVPGLESKIDVIAEGLPSPVAAGPLPEGLEPGFILAVGTVEPRKNYPRLLEAFRQMRGKHGSLPLIINGRPGVPQLVIAGRLGWAYGDTLQRIAAEPGVRYLGHVDEATLTALYESASVLAFPSLYEGFGLPLLEAMSRGVPAVIGEAGALPELAQTAAIAVEPEDVDAIASALERLLSDPQLRQRLGDEGKRRAADFTWDKAAEQTLVVLRRIGTTIHRKVA